MILNQNHNQSKYERARKSSHPTVLRKICKENHQAPTYMVSSYQVEQQSPLFQFCRLQSASEAKIKFYMFTTDEFVLSINSCQNAASDNLFLRGVMINPPMLYFSHFALFTLACLFVVCLNFSIASKCATRNKYVKYTMCGHGIGHSY